MFVWEVLFALVIIYHGFTFSVNDRYSYIIHPVIGIALMTLAIYFIITRVFIYNTLSAFNVIVIIFSSLGLGVLFRIATRVTADKKRRLYIVHGSYINLIPTFALLGINYYLGYLRFTQKDFFLQITPERQELLIAFATVMGTWIVMELCICYKYFKSKSTPIDKK